MKQKKDKGQNAPEPFEISFADSNLHNNNNKGNHYHNQGIQTTCTGYWRIVTIEDVVEEGGDTKGEALLVDDTAKDGMEDDGQVSPQSQKDVYRNIKAS